MLIKFVTYIIFFIGIEVSPWLEDYLDFNVPLDIYAYIEVIGEMNGHDRHWIGTKDQFLRLEGFSIKKSTQFPQNVNIAIEYMAHIEDIGDTNYQAEGTYIGTKQDKRFQGFAIRLVGSDAEKFDIIYRAHLQGTGDTKKYRNGQFCGTRGQQRRVQAIYVQLKRKI